MKGAARARRRRIGDARCVSPTSPSTGRHTNRDRAKDGKRLDLRTRRKPQGAPSEGPTRAIFVGPAWFVGHAMMSWIWTWAGRVAA